MVIVWVKIESWHAVRDSMKQVTLCGLDYNDGKVHEVRNELPAEKSCENCLRIVGRAADTPA